MLLCRDKSHREFDARDEGWQVVRISAHQLLAELFSSVRCRRVCSRLVDNAGPTLRSNAPIDLAPFTGRPTWIELSGVPHLWFQ